MMWNYGQVGGHMKIITHLQGAVRYRKVAHGYLFCGDDGIGKRLVARILAATIQCEAGGIEPCGHCISCMQMMSGNQPDVIWVTHEKSVITVDDIRTQVCGPMAIKPYKGPKKLFIIDYAEQSKEQAQNALFQTLEEPPEYGIILLLTNNQEAMLQTIVSRAVLLPFLPAGIEEVTNYLVMAEHIPDYRAKLAAVFAGGRPGIARSIVSSEDFLERKERVVAWMREIPHMAEDRVAQVAKEFAAHKEDLEQMLSLVTMWLRDLMLVKSTGTVQNCLFLSEDTYLKRQAKEISYEQIMVMMEEIQTLRQKVKANVILEPSVWLFLKAFNQSSQMLH